MILLLLTSVIGCTSSKNQLSFSRYYKDFDIFKRKGINEIDEETVKQLNAENKIFYKLTYRLNKLDSIVITNPYGKSPVMKLNVILNDSVALYVTSYPYQGYDSYYKSYYVFNAKEATQYTHWEDDNWFVIVVKPDSSYGGAKLIEDTVDFKTKLLTNKIINMTGMPAHNIHKFDSRLNSSFTFNSWLSTKD
jgi:hypothetical protein